MFTRIEKRLRREGASEADIIEARRYLADLSRRWLGHLRSETRALKASKRVVRVNGSSGRITVSPGVRNRRRGKNLGTGRDNRRSSQDKPVRHPR